MKFGKLFSGLTSKDKEKGKQSNGTGAQGSADQGLPDSVRAGSIDNSSKGTKIGINIFGRASGGASLSSPRTATAPGQLDLKNEPQMFIAPNWHDSGYGGTVPSMNDERVSQAISRLHLKQATVSVSAEHEGKVSAQGSGARAMAVREILPATLSTCRGMPCRTQSAHPAPPLSLAGHPLTLTPSLFANPFRRRSLSRDQALGTWGMAPTAPTAPGASCTPQTQRASGR